MKICFLTNSVDLKTGWGRYASDLISGVKKASHEVVILKEINDGFEGLPILKRGMGLFLSARKIKKYLKDCDIIHALDGYPYSIIAALANRKLNKKLIITAQGSYSVAPLYNWKTAFLLKWAYKQAQQIIAISSYTKSEILKKAALQNITVINHGIDLNKFYQPYLNSEENFILSVGPLKKRKGYHISIPAFTLAKKKIPDLKYKIVCSKDDSLPQEFSSRLDIEFLTNLSEQELLELYQKAKLFILTSVNEDHHFEGFGLVFLEAAACGLPVIGTKGNGVEDAVKSDYNGILVPQNDVSATAQAIVELINNQKKWGEMSRNSYTWAREHNLETMVKKYIDIYRKLL